MSDDASCEPSSDVFQEQKPEGDTVDRDTVFNNYKSVFSRQFAVSLIVEFVGVMFFQILGGSSAPELAPVVNGIALAVWVYSAANISGGHLNPAVTLSILSCGFYPLVHSVAYVVLQILGAIFGALVTAALVPGASVGMGDGGPGCFDRSGAVSPEITNGQLFGWEVVMTITLISAVYACGVAKPGHGSHTPLVVGLALLCCAGSGGQYTGGALNPARVLGPAIVFQCGGDVWWIYILGQVVAAVLACCVFACVSGLGELNPWMGVRQLRLKWHEAVYLWITGSPPKHLRSGSRDNLTDLRAMMLKLRPRGKASASNDVRALS